MKYPRKCLLYIAASLDGYIAAPGDDLSFLNLVEKEGEDYGYSEFIQRVDTVIIGRKTYDWVLTQVSEFPEISDKTYVISRTLKSSPENEDSSLQFFNGSPSELVGKLCQHQGKHIFVDGGAEIVHDLLVNKLIDEIYLSIIPIILGKGIRLFKTDQPDLNLHLENATAYSTGLVQLHYTRLQK